MNNCHQILNLFTGVDFPTVLKQVGEKTELNMNEIIIKKSGICRWRSVFLAESKQKLQAGPFGAKCKECAWNNIHFSEQVVNNAKRNPVIYEM